MNIFVYRKGITTEDDIIEHILMLLNTSHAGSAIEVPAFCRLESGYDYDRIMEPIVRDKMKRYGVSVQNRGSLQPQTLVMLSPHGAKIYQAGGWKAHLSRLEDKKRRDTEVQVHKDRLEQEKADLERQKNILEVEKLQYEKENRALTEEIQRLTSLNLKLQSADIVGKWAYAVGAVVVTLPSTILLEVWLGAISRAAVWIAQILPPINLN